MRTMTTAQKLQRLEEEVAHLKDLFSALVPLDAEGVYTDAFVRDMRRAANEKATGEYSGKGSLLHL